MPLKYCLHFLACTLLLAGVLPADASGQIEAPEVKVGLLVSLSGPNADFGRSAARAARLCFEQANRRAGRADSVITLVIADDGGDPTAGAEAARRLIREEGVSLILGPLSSAVSLQAAAAAQDVGVPLLSPTATHPALTLTGDYIFRGCFIAPYQALMAARYAHSELASRRCAVLYCADSESSQVMAGVFRREFSALGGEITGFEGFPAGERSFSAVLRRLGEPEPDLLYLPDSYHDAARIAARARAAGIRSQFLGSDDWDSPDLLKIAPLALENALFIQQVFPGCGSHACRDFTQAYREAFDADPDIVAALTYEAALVLVAAIRRAGSTDPAVLRDAVAASDLEILDGRFRFDALRNPVRAGAVLAIENGRIVYREAYRVNY
jgi:branched-chain amino acid transport system substrate-binding protein